MAVIEFDDGIPLPVGTQLNTPGRTVHANPLIRFLTDNIEIQSSTEGGWPTLITGETDGSPVGVAIDYPGHLHGDVPANELNVLIDEEQRWSVLMAYRDRKSAIEEGKYDIDDYEGYELHEWDPESHPDIIGDCFDRRVTPIFYTQDRPHVITHAIQRAESFGPLKRMFRLSQYSKIIEREKELYQRVIPRDERWRDKDTELQDLAKDVLGSESQSGE